MRENCNGYLLICFIMTGCKKDDLKITSEQIKASLKKLQLQYMVVGVAFTNAKKTHRGWKISKPRSEGNSGRSNQLFFSIMKIRMHESLRYWCNYSAFIVRN